MLLLIGCGKRVSVINAHNSPCSCLHIPAIKFLATVAAVSGITWEDVGGKTIALAIPFLELGGTFESGGAVPRGENSLSIVVRALFMGRIFYTKRYRLIEQAPLGIHTGS